MYQSLYLHTKNVRSNQRLKLLGFMDLEKVTRTDIYIYIKEVKVDGPYLVTFLTRTLVIECL